MDTLAALDHLRAVLTEIPDLRLRVPASEIGPAHRLAEDLGVDSVALLDLAMGLEARLGFAIDESELAERPTVGEILDFLVTREA